ncbi:LamB/YcsF family protein [Paenalcaligenes niemegkensis]|uniref:LamB/YcsF family protein n=1 Tax=Paenalcaligenes niemegkensis TaxID=2895469 RepID=UPI001EE9AEA6|nr:5-oxoprolinase subunit PxpA [Paenalcaligenes niemegkensis]MCQ9616712.1 LamB/YcsF family protein [Paenalcaligenes niemegkensis]
MSLFLDLNCDLGESYGAWTMGNDEAVLPLITSANIACGYHAGDPGVMRRTVASAIRHGVALGAHPSLPDLMGFGRREMALTAEQVYDIVVVQVGALQAVAASQGARIHHVKAHGALYHMASHESQYAQAVAQAVHDIDSSLILYALAGSQQLKAGRNMGLRVAEEVFADRSYQRDGTLTPRNQPGALIVDIEAAIAQVLRMVTESTVNTLHGDQIPIHADTLCIHGDNPNAPAFAAAIRDALEKKGVTLRAFL